MRINEQPDTSVRRRGYTLRNTPARQHGPGYYATDNNLEQQVAYLTN